MSDCAVTLHGFGTLQLKRQHFSVKPPLNTHWAAADTAQKPFGFSVNKQHVIFSAKVYRNLGHLVCHKKPESVASLAKQILDRYLPSRQEMSFKMMCFCSSCFV